MRSTSLFTLFGIALCVGATMVGCSGDDDEAAPAVRLSGKGQSCDRTADCSAKLVCVEHTCVESGSSAGGTGNAGSDGSGGSTGGKGGSSGGSSGKGTGGTATGGTGTGGTDTVEPVLGGEGESCTRRADCEPEFRCFNQRCVEEEPVMNGGGGEAGQGGIVPPPPKPLLGQLGETCVLPTDCDAGLTCVPGTNTGNLGVCAYTDAGISATGKACTAECNTATDCCELPLGIVAGASSCADLADDLTGVDCDDPGSFAMQCFVQKVYCNCTADEWDCNNGACSYAAGCEADGLDTLGCPTLSRSGIALVSTCNDGQCRGLPQDPQCTADSQCEGLTILDDSADTCSKDECVCYKRVGTCYRRCARDLDCPVDYECDTATHVCMSAPECKTDFDCVRQKGDVKARCMAGGTCAVTCANDLECNPDGLTGGKFTQVCNDDHVCQDIGCASDVDCDDGTVRMFCVEQPEATTAATPHSAITDGT